MHPSDTALNDFIDGTLGAAERLEVEQHLGGCAVCRQTVDDLREILRAIGEAEPLDAPVRAWSRLERAIRMEREDVAVPGSHGIASRSIIVWTTCAAGRRKCSS